MGFSLIICAVCTADRLQQRVILHGLVQIHHLQNRSVKPGQQLGCDDHQLQRTIRITEDIQYFSLCVTITAVFLVAILFIVIGVHDDRSGILAEQFIQYRLIHQAALTVVDHNLSLVTVWLNFQLEMSRNMFANLPDAGRVIHNRFHIDTA